MGLQEGLGEVKDPYTENYKTLMKETEDNAKKWKDTPRSWIRRINNVKMTILLKATQRFNVIPIQISTIFFLQN